MLFITSAFAQSAPAAASSTGGGLLSVLPLILMFVVLYFIMIRPQMKKQKETKAMISALKKGDEIVTTSGIIGTISSINDTHIVLEISNNVEVLMQRSAVAAVLPKDSIRLAMPN